MPARLHPVVQYADDFDDAKFESTVEDHMPRLADPRLPAPTAAVAVMPTAQPNGDLAAVQRCSPLRIGRDPPQGRRQPPGIPPPPPRTLPCPRDHRHAASTGRSSRCDK